MLDKSFAVAQLPTREILSPSRFRWASSSSCWLPTGKKECADESQASGRTSGVLWCGVGEEGADGNFGWKAEFSSAGVAAGSTTSAKHIRTNFSSLSKASLKKSTCRRKWISTGCGLRPAALKSVPGVIGCGRGSAGSCRAAHKGSPPAFRGCCVPKLSETLLQPKPSR